MRGTDERSGAKRRLSQIGAALDRFLETLGWIGSDCRRPAVDRLLATECQSYGFRRRRDASRLHRGQRTGNSQSCDPADHHRRTGAATLARAAPGRLGGRRGHPGHGRRSVIAAHGKPVGVRCLRDQPGRERGPRLRSVLPGTAGHADRSCVVHSDWYERPRVVALGDNRPRSAVAERDTHGAVWPGMDLVGVRAGQARALYTIGSSMMRREPIERRACARPGAGRDCPHSESDPRAPNPHRSRIPVSAARAEIALRPGGSRSLRRSWSSPGPAGASRWRTQISSPPGAGRCPAR